MNAPLYTLDVLRLAASLEPPRQLDRVDGAANLRAPLCGSTMSTSVTLRNGAIADLSQTVSACAFGQASAALLERSAKGRGRAEVDEALRCLGEWLEGRRDDPGSWPGLDALSPARAKKGRHGAILLPFRTLLEAMDQVR